MPVFDDLCGVGKLSVSAFQRRKDHPKRTQRRRVLDDGPRAAGARARGERAVPRGFIAGTTKAKDAHAFCEVLCDGLLFGSFWSVLGPRGSVWPDFSFVNATLTRRIDPRSPEASTFFVVVDDPTFFGLFWRARGPGPGRYRVPRRAFLGGRAFLHGRAACCEAVISNY